MIHFSDEQLSAFLDSELPESEMEAIRDQLAVDDILTNRIAQLASVDAIVSSTYHAIDEKPLPDSVLKLLDSIDSQKPTPAASVTPLSAWQRIKSGLNNHAPLATAAALVIGLTIGLMSRINDVQDSDYWSTIAASLDNNISGTPITLAEGYTLLPRVSFSNANEQFCRQFVLNTPNNSQHSIACRSSDGWQLAATIYDKPIEAGSYQTASSDSAINKLVDTMAVGTFLNTEQEQKAIRSGWAQ